MRLKGRQARFLVTVLTVWTAARVAQTWRADRPVAAGTAHAEAIVIAPRATRSRPGWHDWPRFEVATSIPLFRSPSRAGFGQAVERPAAKALLTRFGGDGGMAAGALLSAALHADDVTPGRPADAAPSPPAPRSLTASPARWSGEAYLFVRPGSGRAALGPNGQLGGSQAAARLAYRLNPDAPVQIGLAARAYAPLRSKGAEAAFGIDVHPIRDVPLRLSVERRQRLDRAGRSAWSAYAAGGFYREHRAIVIDGYAQAGIVGLERRDLFVDGALRAGVKVGHKVQVGGALWGAAQPNVSRLDIGPRAALRVPIADHGLTVALEGRLRVAGQARPGSGVALTLAADF